jgi:ankyrin repeat protein
MAELLLTQGCVVNACDKKDRRALHWAAHMGYEDVVRLLINHSADTNVKDRDVSTVYHDSTIWLWEQSVSLIHR